jgi:uncharacterized phage infection (PIP) family protein YhgE
MKNLVEFMTESFKAELNNVNEDDKAKLAELEKKVDQAKKDAKDAKKDAKDAKDDAKDAQKEADKAAESIKDEKSFRDYAENKFKEVFGDKLDEKKMKETIDGILSDNKDAVDAGDWGKLVGILNKSFGS